MHCSTLRSDFGLLVTLHSLAVEQSQDQTTVDHLQIFWLLNISCSAWQFAVMLGGG